MFEGFQLVANGIVSMGAEELVSVVTPVSIENSGELFWVAVESGVATVGE
jgi:hypothetical protein